MIFFMYLFYVLLGNMSCNSLQNTVKLQKCPYRLVFIVFSKMPLNSVWKSEMRNLCECFFGKYFFELRNKTNYMCMYNCIYL